MIQTPAFRNINIFFLIQTYGSYIYTVQKIILRPAGPRFITAMTGGGRWLQEGTQGEERGGQRGTPLLFFSLLSLGGGWIYTRLAGGLEGLYIVLDTVRSTPPPIHGPSYSHSVAFSLDRHHAHAHTINYTLCSLSLSLSPIHAHFPIFLLLTFSFVSTRYSSDIFFFLLFFSPFLVIYTRARVHVCRVLIFSNI